jgi:NADH dehydrogenase FAD-containing subunit
MAGLEAAFLLEMRLSGRVDLHVVYDDERFVLRPNLVYVPFGSDLSASSLWIAEALARKAINGDRGRIEGVDADTGRVQLAGGRQLPYEHLVIASGALPWPQAVPGLREHALGIGQPAAMTLLRERFLSIRGRAREGTRQRVLFVVPRHCPWPVALYEIALMLDTWLRRERVRQHVELGLLTHEASFAEAAGARMHDVLAEQFAERSIEALTGERVAEVRSHEASFVGGRVERFDILVAAAPHRPSVDSQTRQVVGHPELYAPGDAGDFPLKDSYLALLQADAAADHIAAVVSGRRAKRPFDATSMLMIDMLDTAAFAQIPLEETGDPDRPVRVRPGAEGDYKVDISRRWRAGKRLFSSYLLMQFSAGAPFDAGPGWRFMDVGVHAMAGMP